MVENTDKVPSPINAHIPSLSSNLMFSFSSVGIGYSAKAKSTKAPKATRPMSHSYLRSVEVGKLPPWANPMFKETFGSQQTPCRVQYADTGLHCTNKRTVEVIERAQCMALMVQRYALDRGGGERILIRSIVTTSLGRSGPRIPAGPFTTTWYLMILETSDGCR
jgi:hypothetical protein